MSDVLEATAKMRVLIARLEREGLAVPLEAVAAVIAAPAPAPLPFAPAYVQGIVAWQGQLVPVLDVAPLLGLDAARDRGAALVLRQGEGLAALLVAAVLGEAELAVEARDATRASRPVSQAGAPRAQHTQNTQRLDQSDPAGEAAAAPAFARPARTADGADVQLLDVAAVFATVNLTAVFG